MLEQSEVPEEEAAAAAGSKEKFYTPRLAGEALSGRVPDPPVKRFSRKAIAVTALLTIGIAGAAFYEGLQPPKKKSAPPAESASRPPAPAAALASLHGSYADPPESSTSRAAVYT